MSKELKLYYSIREVAGMLNIPEHTLRFWEKEFPTLSPKKSKKDTGTRKYTKEDIEMVRLIHHLVKEQGLTIKAARERLKTSKRQVVDQQEIVSRLKSIRAELLEMQAKLDELYPGTISQAYFNDSTVSPKSGEEKVTVSDSEASPHPCT